MKRLFIIFLSLFSGLVFSQESSQDAEREAVVYMANQFFKAMTERDTILAKEIFIDGAQYFGIGEGKDRPFRRTADEWIKGLPNGEDKLIERIWDPTVMIHGPIAILWAPYDIYINGKFLHCGIDIFNFIKVEGKWKITGITFTMEPNNCKESPLGPLKDN